jgi:hypothetical protein
MKFLYRVYYHREIEADSQGDADDLVSATPLPADYVPDTQDSILLGITDYSDGEVIATCKYADPNTGGCPAFCDYECPAELSADVSEAEREPRE